MGHQALSQQQQYYATLYPRSIEVSCLEVELPLDWLWQQQQQRAAVV
jgi:hypothetical protein